MADGSDKTSKGIQKRLKREAHPRPLPREGRRSLSPNPSPKREGSKMQIDLANILVHKVYSIHNDIIHHCLQAWPPLLRRGVGEASLKTGRAHRQAS